MKGWVYVIANPSMPGKVKVGFSTKDPQQRAKELEHTGLPDPHRLVYDALVEDPQRVEGAAHRELARVHYRREWFTCEAGFAADAIRRVAGGRAIVEQINAPDLMAVPVRRSLESGTVAGAAQLMRTSAGAERSAAPAVDLVPERRPQQQAAFLCWNCGTLASDRLPTPPCSSCGTKHPLGQKIELRLARWVLIHTAHQQDPRPHPPRLRAAM